MDDEYKPPTYPVVQFLVAHGMKLAIALGLLGALTGFAGAVAGAPWYWAVAGLAGGALLAGVLASYVEVLRIIADTLMPK
ncbi:MAG: hypothetical protein V4632_21690 [Pseudomonadota bacterium]